MWFQQFTAVLILTSIYLKLKTADAFMYVSVKKGLKNGNKRSDALINPSTALLFAIIYIYKQASSSWKR